MKITSLNRIDICLPCSIFLNIPCPTTSPRWECPDDFGFLPSQPLQTHHPNLLHNKQDIISLSYSNAVRLQALMHKYILGL